MDRTTQIQNWRKYQRRLQRGARRRRLLLQTPKLVLYGGIAFLFLTIFFLIISWVSAHLGRKDPSKLAQELIEEKPPLRVERETLASLLGPEGLDSSHLGEDLPLTLEGAPLFAKTSIDADLQTYVATLLGKSKTLQAAVVVLEPDDGRILSMVSYDPEGRNPSSNLCLDATFPAASLFKIVSAAAAVEACGFYPDRSMAFEGGKYTLYKRQLKPKNGRYVTKTTFRRAFAGSVNPVFGRIGIYVLGKDHLETYSDRFMFNKTIPFDFPLPMSQIEVPEDDFGLAEIASGFNKRTLMSPLHAALVTSSIVNEGKMMNPWMIRSVVNSDGKVLYRTTHASIARPVTEETARIMRILMEDTVKYGTCRRAFRPMLGKKAFKGMTFGAKTGTINDKTDTFRLDWTVAYALPKKGSDGICIAVLAVHGEKLGIRAKDLTRYIMSHYFSS